MEITALTNIWVQGQARAALRLNTGYLDLALAMKSSPASFPIAIVEDSDLPRSILEAATNPLIRQWLTQFAGEFQSAAQGGRDHWRELSVPLEDVPVLPPVLRPGKVICVGLNYPGVEPSSSSPQYPVLFNKVATSIIAAGDAIQLPIEAEGLSYEGELAIVIGKTGKRIPQELAHQYIAGFTVANDIGAPDIQARTSQWTSGKMLDTFCPLGPNLVLADQILRPESLTIETHLNDELVQRAPVADMLFDIPSLIAYISSLVTLEPGDLVLTGSPKKVDGRADPQKLMKAGDVISVSIQPLGTLSNPIAVEE